MNNWNDFYNHLFKEFDPLPPPHLYCQCLHRCYHYRTADYTYYLR